MVKITSTRWLLLLGASIILGLMLFGLFHEVTILSEGGVEILSTIKIQRNGTFEQLQASNFIHEFESEPVSWTSERLVLFNFTLTPEPEMPRGMSSIECDDGECCSSIFINRSCVYSNLYYSEQKFSMFLNPKKTNKPIAFDSHGVATGIRHLPEYDAIHPHFFPTPIYLDDDTFPQNLSSETFHYREGIFLILTGAPHSNWAHAILDNLYSIWLVLCKFNLESESSPKFTAVVLDTIGSTSAETIQHDNFRVFLGGLEFQRDWPVDAMYRFERVAAGTGHMGLSTPGTDYVMPGRKYDALKKMRTRFYTMYQRQVPLIRASSMQNRSAIMNVLIVPNRRNSNGVLTRDMQALVTGSGYGFMFLDWALPFADRMDLIREANIAVTGVGTGACNLFLQSDGTVIVNLGTTERSGSLSFQEEFLFAGMYWVRMVYPTYEQYKQMSPSVAMQLINVGKETILSNFDSSRTVQGEVNFSPVGKGGSAYFRTDITAWGAFVGSHVQNPGAGFDDGCLNMVERLLCRTGPWGNDRCSITNQSLIHNLCVEYGVHCA